MKGFSLLDASVLILLLGMVITMIILAAKV